MSNRLEAEVRLLRDSGWEVETDPDGHWVIVLEIPLEAGWSRLSTNVLIRIPAGYPTTPPDNFWTAADLLLANGAQPGSTSQGETIAGRPWLTFSYHVEAGSWEPHAEPERGHNLLSYLGAVRKRLGEAN